VAPALSRARRIKGNPGNVSAVGRETPMSESRIDSWGDSLVRMKLYPKHASLTLVEFNVWIS